MRINKRPASLLRTLIGFFLFLGIIQQHSLFAQSLDIPSKKWGISFGNSKDWSGLRFNFRDSRVRRVNGINFTLWLPRKDNRDVIISGLPLGVIPGGG
jgi:hypothetical protein